MRVFAALGVTTFRGGVGGQILGKCLDQKRLLLSRWHVPPSHDSLNLCGSLSNPETWHPNANSNNTERHYNPTYLMCDAYMASTREQAVSDAPVS